MCKHVRRTSIKRTILALAAIVLFAVDGQAEGLRTSGATVTADQPKEQLSVVAKSAISESIGRDQSRYHAVKVGGTFRLRHPNSNITAVLTPLGARMEKGSDNWSLSLKEFGASGALRAVKTAQPQATGNRVEYRRGELVEWYVNGPAGLEQGFTIERKPTGAASDTLVLALGLSGNLTPHVEADRRGLALHDSSGATALRYAGLVAWDATGRELNTWLEAGNSRLQVRVDAAEAQYPVVVDPYILVATLTTPGTDQLGWAASVSADGSTVVAGSNSDDLGSIFNSGSAYVFVKPLAGWSNLTSANARLIASDAAIDDRLGMSVSVSEDGSTVIAGPNSQRGAYLFVKPAGGWGDPAADFDNNPANGIQHTETAKLTAGGSPLGISVSVSADGNTAVAGATSGTGAAYVFVKPDGGWLDNTETARLTASDAAGGDQLGVSVSVSGDGRTVVAGASGEDGSKGSVYLFVKPDGGWVDNTETAKLTASDAATGDQLGITSGVSGNGSTVVAGALGDDGFKGALYVFVKPGELWTSGTQTTKLTASDAAANDQLGFSASVSQDGNTVVGGAIGHNEVKGAVYVFLRPLTGWATGTNETAKLINPSADSGDRVGHGLGVSKHGGTVVASSPLAGFRSNAGAAYVMVLDEEGQIQSLLVQVDQFVDDDVLKTGQANGLMKPLLNALKSLAQNKTISTCSQMQDFIDEVNHKYADGALGGPDALDLIQQAQAIREQLGCM